MAGDLEACRKLYDLDEVRHLCDLEAGTKLYDLDVFRRCIVICMRRHGVPTTLVCHSCRDATPI
jgi:hypothetical protein